MQLSKHFKLEEFEKSMTATRKGISNKAGSGEISNLTDLCYAVLEPVRAKFEKPIIITSGYRTEALCEILKSSNMSMVILKISIRLVLAAPPKTSAPICLNCLSVW